jgi:hypothetical protein
MSKKWYTITFSAQMTEDDVRAMKKCFYDAMEEAMEISPCANLEITLEDDQDEEADLVLDSEELLDFDMRTGNIKVDKDIFDDFIPNTYVNIQFVDDNREDRIAQYKMISEDDEGIIMEYIGEAD